MALDPQPITLTQSATNPSAAHDPQPFLVVGDLPVPTSAVVALTAVPALADTAAVQAYLTTLVGQLKSSPYFS